MPQAVADEVRRTLALALALSAGLHAIALLTLDVAPGAWRHGVAPALRVVLEAGTHAADAAPAHSGDRADLSARAAPATSEAEGTRDAHDGARSRADRAPAAADDDGNAARADGLPAPQSRHGASLPTAERYFRSNEVDTKARIVYRAPLIYPEYAYMTRLAGTVRARIYISEDGTVDSVSIESARPPGHFEAAALEALRQLRYQPAEIRGVPVKSQKLVEVTFDPYEGETQAAPPK